MHLISLPTPKCRVFSRMHQYSHIGYANIEIFLYPLEILASLSLPVAFNCWIVGK